MQSNSVMTAISHPVLSTCRALDRMRVRVLRLLGSPGKVLVRRRDLRVAVFGCTAITAAWAGSLLIPLWMLALGPVILGTPHILSDVRYLVMRPGYHRRLRFWLPVGIPLVLAGADWHAMECGLGAAIAAALLADGKVWRKLAAASVVSGLLALAVSAGDVSRLIFAHVHNLVALILWWVWRPRTSRTAYLVPLLFGLAVMALTFGWVSPVAGAWSWIPGGIGLGDHAEALAPGFAGDWAIRLVLLFAFAQSVHYGIWLRLIPEDDRPRDTPRTFSATVRAMEQDVGRPLLWTAGIIGLAITVWAIADLAEARTGYLRMALFHGYLELVALALLFIEGRRTIAARSTPAVP